IVWLMMLDDTPHSIAMGVAVGLFVGLTPTVGVQMLLVVLVSLFIRCNRTVGCALVWLTNPLTMVPVYFFNYMVGTWVLRIQPVSIEVFGHKITDAFHHVYWHERLVAMVRAMGRLAIDVAGPMWLGSVVVSVVLAVPAYFFVKWGVVTYRRAHQRRLEAALARQSSADAQTREEKTYGETPQDR
ncbi:MAG TPA: DUF2062 domain-containing protein, partial [Planctomycetota bacterium]|nr:DUF2062 domain-containing protein [Planctomycetota bacterium]